MRWVPKPDEKYPAFIFNTWRKTGDFFVRGALACDDKVHPGHPYACWPLEKLTPDRMIQNPYWDCLGFQEPPSMVYRWILKVAVKHKGEVFSMFPPNRHHNVIDMIIKKLKIPESEWPVGGHGPENQGFICSDGHYLIREEAYRVAQEAGQIIRDPDPTKYQGKELYSEDVW